MMYVTTVGYQGKVWSRTTSYSGSHERFGEGHFATYKNVISGGKVTDFSSNRSVKSSHDLKRLVEQI